MYVKKYNNYDEKRARKKNMKILKVILKIQMNAIQFHHKV